MFGVTKEKLIEGLSVLQKKHCGYIGDSCDCKYGINKDSKSHHEQNGCPELRMVISIMEKMTKKQFESFCNKAKVIVWSDE